MKGIEVKNPENKKSSSFPVVAIGASAGGIEAVSELLQNLPRQTGMCYIYIQHLPHDHKSKLTEILGRTTPMPVLEAKDKMRLQPDQMYIIPPHRDLVVTDGELQLVNRPIRTQLHLPIDLFFKSVAEQYREKAIGILLSGNPPDGALGLKAIKTAGGITFAQNNSAQFQGMSKNAEIEEAVDLLLSPKEMAGELTKLAQQQATYQNAISALHEDLISDRDEHLANIIRIIYQLTGADFSYYKPNTIKRRIIRRMVLNKMETLEAYVQQLKQYANEVHQLYQDLLINVTSFFRDAEATSYLKKEVLPKIIKQKAPDDAIRIWVPACSTGQEAYSLAMLMMEVLGEKATAQTVQVFATDLSEPAINKARLGLYSKAEVADMDPKRLQRFFTKVDGSYRIIKNIRDVCVFAVHNVLKDPPFSRQDLISCCNLMIYLEPVLQKKLLSTFHYTLNPYGYLVLGESETIGNSALLFNQVDKQLKIYAKKKDVAAKAMFEMTYRGGESNKAEPYGSKVGTPKVQRDDMDLNSAVDTLLLKKYTPASVVVNADMDIVQFRGSTGLFLEPAPGKASLNLLKMARQDLGFELRGIILKAIKSGEAEQKTWTDTTDDNRTRKISIEAIPIKLATGNLNPSFLVVFDEQVTEQKGPAVSSSDKDKKAKQLEAEMAALREDMRSLVESLESANEELQSVNEEILSSNEELQSINEELETSKEELESSNEELITINQELQMRNEQLVEVQEYSEAIFTTIREAVLVLDKSLRVKNANRCFYSTFKVTEEETEGKLLYELGNNQWNIPKLKELLEDIIPRNSQVSDYAVEHHFSGIGHKVMLLNARRLVRKLHSEHLILLAIEDITEYKRSEKMLAEREQWYHSIADNSPMMIWVTDIQQRNKFVNQTWLEYRNMTLEEAVGKHFVEELMHPDDKKKCLQIVDNSFKSKKPFELQYRMQKEDRYVTIHSKGKPYFEKDGRFTGFIGSCMELPLSLVPALEPSHKD